jgi:hypothetical protein
VQARFRAHSFPEETIPSAGTQTGLTHFAACPPAAVQNCPSCRPSPCDRLSRSPWWRVTSTTRMAALSPCSRLGRQRVALPSTFLSARPRTVRDRFRVTRLSGSSFAPVQHKHITCASPCKAVHLDCFALCVAFPRSPVGHDSHDYYQSSVAISLAEGRRSRVSSRWYVLATDVGHPLISLLDLIDHRP